MFGYNLIKWCFRYVWLGSTPTPLSQPPVLWAGKDPLRDPIRKGFHMELETQKITASFFNHHTATQLVWLGMAGILINTRGTIFLVDPLITMENSRGETLCEGLYRLKTPLPIEAIEMPRVDLVLYTHADNDHYGALTAQVFANQTQCRFMAPPPVKNLLEELGVQKARIITSTPYQSTQVAGAEVTVTPALHDWQELDPWRWEDCCGYLIKTKDGTIWHPGDTRWIDELSEFQDVDVLMFDVAAVDSHLGPEGSARLAESSGARIFVAYHYGTFDLPPGSFASCSFEDSLPYVARLSGSYLAINPGELVHLPIE